MTTMNIPTIDMAATGRNIEFLRKQAGLSVRNLQDIFGFGTPQAIYKWQHGTAIPSVDNLVILAAILHVKVDDILVIEIPGSYKGGVTQGDTPSVFSYISTKFPDSHSIIKNLFIDFLPCMVYLI